MRLATIDRNEVTEGMDLSLWFLPNGYAAQGGTVVNFDTDTVTLRCGTDHHVCTIDWAEVHHVTIDQALDPEECLQFGPECEGVVDWHTTGSSMKAWPRCQYHAAQRQNRYENSSERYADSDLAPADFDRSWGGANEYGEHWSEDDY